MPGGTMMSTPGTAPCSSSSISRSSSARCRGFVGREAHHPRLRQKRIEQTLFGGISCPVLHAGELFLAEQLHRGLDQVFDDGIDIAADITDLGELGRLDLHEGCARESRQAAGDLGLADAGGADHQDVLGRDLGAQRLPDLHATPAVAQCDGDGALGGLLTDDVFVELGDDLARRQGVAHACSSSMTRLRLV
jgi:hypothetical protein